MIRFKTSAGFTIVELVTVIAILLTLAALLVPVYARSKESAKIADDFTRLHQCQLACAMYQTDHGYEGALPFGLPDIESAMRGLKLSGFYGLKMEQTASACGRHPLSLTEYFDWWLFAPPTPRELAYLEHYGERSPLFIDENCNDAGVDITAEFVTKRAIAVLVNGTVVTRTREGNPFSEKFWEFDK
jgi:hypothetical protein